MKKILFTSIILLSALTTASAQEKQPIGYAHTVSFGAAYGYSSAPLANFGSGMIDINFGTGINLPKDSYFRTRLSLNIDQITKSFGASAGASFQYMQNIAGGLFVYPFINLQAEYHNAYNWDKKADFTPGAGAGLEYQFNSNIGLFVQGTYEYGLAGKYARPIGQAGVVFAFGKPKAAAPASSAKAEAKAAQKAAKAAEQRAKAEQAAADQMRKEAAEQAAKAAKAEPVAEPVTAAVPAEAPAQPDMNAAKPVPVVMPEKTEAPAEVAAAPLTSDAVPANGIRINKGTTVSVPFMAGSHEVGNSAKTKILAMVPYLMSHPEAKVEIAAYGDKKDAKSDAKLANERERAVRDIITGAGINIDRIVEPEETATSVYTTKPGSVAIVTIK